MATHRDSSLFYATWVPLCFLILGVPCGWGQVSTATISGTVKDTTGAVMPGSSITVKNVDTGIARTTSTDHAGRYAVPNLEVGNYEAQAESSGFQKAVRTGITLTVGREAVVDFSMSVGQVAEAVTVTGEAPLVETSNTAVGGLVNQSQMRNLPLNGRNYTQLALLVPGVQQITTSAGSSQSFGGRGLRISVAGSRPEGQVFLIDDTNVQGFWNQGAGATIAGTSLGVEAIREFETLTNTYSAQFGGAGAVLNAVTRSGSNNVHGSIFEFLRNSALDAKNFFDLRSRPIPPFRRNQFGASSGGPIRREKTFFFGNYEGLREALGVTQLAFVPDLQARQGFLPDPANPGRLMQVPIAPGVKPSLDAYPLPNGRNFANGTAEVISSELRPINEDFFVLRMDHNLSDSDSFFGRYTFDNATLVDPYPGGPMPGFPENDSARNQYLTLEGKKIISPTIVNSARFSFVRTKHGAFNATQLSALQYIPIPGRQVGSLTLPTLSQLGPGVLTPFQFIQNGFTGGDDVNLTKSGHAIRFGGEVQRLQSNYFLDFFSGGRYAFNTLQDLLTSKPFSFVGALPGKLDTRRGWRQTVLAFYFQDNYKLASRLTLNLGLRYEFSNNPSEVNGRLSHLVDPIHDPAFSAVKHVFRQNPSLRNLAPRVGFAWDVTGDQKSSVRGGFGIFYNQLLPRTYAHIAFNPPFTLIGFALSPTFPNPLEKGVGALLPSVSEVASYGISNTPYMMQYNLNVDRELLPGTVFRVGYVGSRGVHLILSRDANSFAAQVLPDGRRFWPAGAPRVNPNFGSLNLKFADANSNYNSLQLALNKRYGRGLQVQLAYTFARSIDDASITARQEFENSAEGLQDPFGDRSLDRGLSNFDIRHNLTISYLYSLPFPGKISGAARKLLEGWELSGVTSVTSGPPFTIENGFDRARTGRTGVQLADRPNLRAGGNNNPKLGSIDRWFDPSQFALQDAGFLGNLGRNTVTGPGMVNFDFALLKETRVPRVAENFAVQFRAEFFNIFNHPNFAVPNPENRFVFSDPSGIPSASAGRLSRTVTSSRQIQFGLKLIF